MIGPYNSIQLGTPCLLVPTLGDDYLIEISSLFVETYIVDLGDIIDDVHLLFARTHSDPYVHSLHDQSLQVDVIVGPYVQQLQEVS